MFLYSFDPLLFQVGDFMSADQGWNPPEDSDPHTRTIHVANSTHPAADVACDVAAALASASILFNSTGECNYLIQ